MGRLKKLQEDKKQTVSVCLDTEVYDKLESLQVKKSQLINWLLKEHFGELLKTNNKKLNTCKNI